MRMNPDARSLLAVALDTYRAEVLPHVPAEQRYAALMIANALSIAQRELDGRDAAGRAMLEAVAPLYDEDADVSLSGPELFERVEGLQRRLCADIAAGDFDADGETRAALMAALEVIVRARLSIANPKALKAAP